MVLFIDVQDLQRSMTRLVIWLDQRFSNCEVKMLCEVKGTGVLKITGSYCCLAADLATYGEQFQKQRL